MDGSGYCFFVRHDLGFLVGGSKCSFSEYLRVGSAVLKWRNYDDVRGYEAFGVRLQFFNLFVCHQLFVFQYN